MRALFTNESGKANIASGLEFAPRAATQPKRCRSSLGMDTKSTDKPIICPCTLFVTTLAKHGGYSRHHHAALLRQLFVPIFVDSSSSSSTHRLLSIASALEHLGLHDPMSIRSARLIEEPVSHFDHGSHDFVSILAQLMLSAIFFYFWVSIHTQAYPLSARHICLRLAVFVMASDELLVFVFVAVYLRADRRTLRPARHAA